MEKIQLSGIDLKNIKELNEKLGSKQFQKLLNIIEKIQDDKTINKLLQIYLKALAGKDTVPLKGELGRVAAKLKLTTRVQKDKLDELLYSISDFIDFLDMHNLESLPVDRRYLLDNSDKILEILTKMQKNIQKFDTIKQRLVINKARECGIKGKVISKNGKYCVAIETAKRQIKPIPETKIDDFWDEYPDSYVGKEYRDFLEDVSKKLNIAMYRRDFALSRPLSREQRKLWLSNKRIKIWIKPHEKLPVDWILEERGNNLLVSRPV